MTKTASQIYLGEPPLGEIGPDPFEIVTFLESLQDSVATGLLPAATWVELQTLTFGEGILGGTVNDSDSGTHLQATATGYDGASVPNAGTYRYVAEWDRLKWIGDTGLAGKSNVGHGHNVSDVTGLQAEIDAKANTADIAGSQRDNILRWTRFEDGIGPWTALSGAVLSTVTTVDEVPLNTEGLRITVPPGDNFVAAEERSPLGYGDLRGRVLRISGVARRNNSNLSPIVIIQQYNAGGAFVGLNGVTVPMTAVDEYEAFAVETTVGTSFVGMDYNMPRIHVADSGTAGGNVDIHDLRYEDITELRALEADVNAGLAAKADDAATTAALAAKADDAATTAALATKADDAATTAALAAKADGRIIDDDGFIVADEDGNVTLKLGADGILRVLAAAFGTVGVSANASVPWSVGDAAGDLLAMLTDEGMMRSSGFEGAGFRLITSAIEGFAFCIKDEDGNIPFGIALNGDVLVPQSESQEVAPSNVVDFTFVEGWGDASESLAVSWVNDTTTADVVGLRLSGVPAPSYARSIRTRAFPHVAGKYIHTALFQGLSAGATYEISFPGATMLDHVRVPPRAGVKVAMMSDYQQFDFSSSGLLGLFGTVVGAKDVDFMVLNGDYVSDDGVQGATQGSRWFSFLAGLTRYYRTTSGAMIPFIATTGNHEGIKLEGTGNALYGGDGNIGMIAEILSWGYDPEQEGRNRNSAARLTIGKELLLLTLETDHTEPLPDQLPWLQQQLADYAADFRHVAVFGHSPAFFGGDNYELDDFANQARALRNDFWPAMSQYADKIRFYGAGHDHFLGVTARLKMDPDEGLTHAENDVRWTTASDGVRQLGCGPWGGNRNNLNDDDMAEVSSLDGSPKFLAAIGYNAAFDEVVIHGTGLTNTTKDFWNIWVAEFDSTAFTATAFGSAGQQFYTLTENL